ncbi:uncharacterized protein TNIN_26301 [Trichonephila inaurata madagascariensis]|uniref:EGF-like domain-containing protein n=1 Tax=Trichonephila inaurata madagascariensis TaxID=2747483 RepID=A0A8X6XFA0_9ARAC|nr:uncharacterized protein TNIN_26301 [Trichonephila inaurata madagascariensis]
MCSSALTVFVGACNHHITLKPCFYDNSSETDIESSIGEDTPNKPAKMPKKKIRFAPLPLPTSTRAIKGGRQVRLPVLPACDTDDQCSNGKKCRLTEGGGVKTCQCLPGKSGNDCETIDDCDYGKYKDCNGDNGKCEYDDQEETAVCRCEGGKILDETAGTCKACHMDDQCSNGKKCRAMVDGGDKTCQCPPGKSGNYCEKIDECDSGKYKDCNGDNGKCEYDDQEETAVCRCEGGKILNESSGICKETNLTTTVTTDSSSSATSTEMNSTTTVITESSSSSTSPEATTITKIVSTDSSSSTMTTVDEAKEIDPCTNDPCENGGTCEKRDNNTFACFCVPGYTGDRCQEIEWCKENGKTVCGNEECRFDEKRSSGFCFCRNDSFFDSKEKRCKKMDSCLIRHLSGECNMAFETCGAGECKCKDGYDYSTNRTSCEPAFCKNKPCGRNMNCEETSDSFVCFCKDNYNQVGKDCVKCE